MSYALLKTNLTKRDAIGVELIGTHSTTLVVTALVFASVEFHVEPLPNNHYQITVKREAEATLQAVVVAHVDVRVAGWS